MGWGPPVASQVSKSQNCMLPSLPPRARYGTAFVRPSSVHLNSVTRSSPFSITHSLSQSEREEPKHGRRLQVHSATSTSPSSSSSLSNGTYLLSNLAR